MTRQQRKHKAGRGLEWLTEKGISPDDWANRHNPQYRLKGRRYL